MTYYGRLDTRPEKMPSKRLMRTWEREAKDIYERDQADIGVTKERFIMNYVGNQIADYQEQVRASQNAGRFC